MRCVPPRPSQDVLKGQHVLEMAACVPLLDGPVRLGSGLLSAWLGFRVGSRLASGWSRLGLGRVVLRLVKG